jgi:hypothetical protein
MTLVLDVYDCRGPAVGHATIFVTDGQFIWTGQLEVQASKPYINITTNTGISVFRLEYNSSHEIQILKFEIQKKKRKQKEKKRKKND